MPWHRQAGELREGEPDRWARSPLVSHLLTAFEVFHVLRTVCGAGDPDMREAGFLPWKSSRVVGKWGAGNCRAGNSRGTDPQP